MQLDLDVEKRSGLTVLTVRGDLDLATGPALRQRVAGLVVDGERRFALDLRPLDFLDSLGLGMIVAVLKRVRSVGGELFVVADEPRIRKVFELTDLVGAVGLVSQLDDRLER